MIHIIDLGFLNTVKTVAAFLVESGPTLTLVETGPHSTFAQLRRGVENLGFRLEDIQQVLLSHIHLDHAGAAWALAENGATIHVHPFGAPHLRDPSKLLQSARRIYQDQMEALWGRLSPIDERRLRPAAHGQEITIGQARWKAWHTPGHAVHHIAWQLDDEIFTGDVAGVCIDQGLVVPPCPPPDIDVEDWRQSLQLLRALSPRRLLLTHFGAVENPMSHLDQLEARLEAWAQWMLPHYQRGASVEEATPEFQAFARQELIDSGATPLQLHQYECANPAWMSVTGLMRYWKKKHAGA
jgi:glyoxylase-like metal-dependent hydrolase (beta-lactamase superfamily II)